MEIKAIFFDLDDTLHDHLLPFSTAVKMVFPDLYESLQVELLYKRFRHFSDVFWKTYSENEMSLEELRKRRIILAFEYFHIPITTEQADRFQNQYEAALENLNLFPEAIALLETLINKGYLVGMITNGPVNHQLSKIESLGLLKFIPREWIFISDEVGVAKPNSQIFSYVGQRTGLSPSEHLYIGDTWSNDVAAANDAGWKAIWFNHRRRQPETNHQPFAVINRLDLVLNVLKNPDKP